MALTMAYAFAGNISGGGSPDPGKNRGKAGVWQPYSILIGDTWYEYARIQPTGTLMGMAADIAAAEAILLCVTTSKVVEDTIRQLKPHLRPGKIILDAGTSAPAATNFS
jgi:hypothetical protein